jgi:hypothetical protein
MGWASFWTNFSHTHLVSLPCSQTLAIKRFKFQVYDVGNLLAAVGGNLGLFLGFSCLSLLLGVLRVAKKLARKKCERSSV